MAIEKNYAVNDKKTYKKKSLNFMYIYKNYVNILRQQKKTMKLKRREY